MAMAQFSRVLFFLHSFFFLKGVSRSEGRASTLGPGRAVYNVILKCGDCQAPAGTSGGWVNFKAVVAGKKLRAARLTTPFACILSHSGNCGSLAAEVVVPEKQAPSSTRCTSGQITVSIYLKVTTCLPVFSSCKVLHKVLVFTGQRSEARLYFEKNNKLELFFVVLEYTESR